jgi:hypothetical protein
MENKFNIEILTKKVMVRDKEVEVNQLKPNSSIRVLVKCKHEERLVRWNRRFSGCYKCRAETGVYNTSPKGRRITWGDKISQAKKGKLFSEEHKQKLLKVRAQKICDKQGIPLSEFKGFPTSGIRFKVRNAMMSFIKRSIIHHSIEEQDSLFLSKLGYKPEDLIKHLESLFQLGMTWDNYGQWHIDHVVPESWFLYISEDDEEFKKCWALSNLQPLWAKQNIDKSNKYAGAYKPRRLYMLAGQFGCGKTTTLSKLTDKFTTVSADKMNKKQLMSFIANNYFNDRPILLDIATLISTTHKALRDKYEIVMIYIIESTDIIKQRLATRGGSSPDKNIQNRFKRMQSLSKNYPGFVGTADEVLKYLQELDLTVV